MTSDEHMAMLRGAAYMREKIAQCLECNTRKPIQEAAGHVRDNITLPEAGSVESVADTWLDSVVLAELNMVGDREDQ